MILTNMLLSDSSVERCSVFDSVHALRRCPAPLTILSFFVPIVGGRNNTTSRSCS